MHTQYFSGIDPVITGLTTALKLRNYDATQLGSVDRDSHFHIIGSYDIIQLAHVFMMLCVPFLHVLRYQCIHTTNYRFSLLNQMLSKQPSGMPLLTSPQSLPSFIELTGTALQVPSPPVALQATLALSNLLRYLYLIFSSYSAINGLNEGKLVLPQMPLRKA